MPSSSSSSKHHKSSRHHRERSSSSQSSSGYSGGSRGSGADQKHAQKPPGGCDYCDGKLIPVQVWEPEEIICDGQCHGNTNWRGAEIKGEFEACFVCRPDPPPGRMRNSPNKHCAYCHGWGMLPKRMKCSRCHGNGRRVRMRQVPKLVECTMCNDNKSYAF